MTGEPNNRSSPSPTPSLFKETATGVFWSGGGQVLAQIVHLLTRLILARLLAPEDFGLVAMAMVAVGFTYWFLDLGVGPALVQRRDLTEEHKSTAFWVNLAMAVVVFAGIALLSPLISQFFGAPELDPILIALGFSLVLATPGGVPEALFAREFGFQLIAVRRIIGTLLGGGVGIGLALAGFGAWALVAQTLANQFVGSVLLLVKSAWRPRLVVSRAAFVDLWSFSRPLVGGRLLNYFNRNLDTILVGRYLGATLLGYYNVGYQLVLLPLIYVTRPVTKVLFTALSRLQDQPHRMQRAYLQAMQSVAFVTFPIMTGLALTAPSLIPELLGEKWRPAGALAPFLCLVGLVQSVLNLVPAVLQAKGETSLMFHFSLATLSGDAIAYVMGLRWGIFGVAIAYACSTLILAPFLLRWLLQILDLQWSVFLRALGGAAISTVVMTVVWFVAGWFVLALGADPDSLIVIALRILAAAAVYLGTLWYRNPVIRDYYHRSGIESQIHQWIGRGQDLDAA